MEDGAEYSGRTVDEAIEQAASALGVDRDALNVEVITQGSRGVFGIGAENARIRATPKQAATRAEPPAPRVTEQATAAVATEEPPASAEQAPAPQTAAQNGAALAADAQQVLQELLESMGFDAEVNVRGTDNPIMLAITGRNLGVLIGRRGDNLAALQFMVNLILSKNRRQWPRVVIDVENYRARREESLRTLADRIAYRVRRNQRPFTLEAMPASDRRIIHLALRDRPDVETYSIGEGPARRVVIAPKQRSRRSEYRDEEED